MDILPENLFVFCLQNVFTLLLWYFLALPDVSTSSFHPVICNKRSCCWQCTIQKQRKVSCSFLLPQEYKGKDDVLSLANADWLGILFNI